MTVEVPQVRTVKTRFQILPLHSSKNMGFSSTRFPGNKYFQYFQKSNKCMERRDLYMFFLFRLLKCYTFVYLVAFLDY